MPITPNPSHFHPVLIVIPARLSSQRLPRKMLLADTGKPLVQHTWEAASKATRAGQVVVATDSEEIAAAVAAFGGTAVMTSPAAPSGTARIVEALWRFPDAEVIVNVQGDEPELAPEAIDLAIDLLARCPEAGIATLVTPLRSRDDLADPSAVKAVLTPWRERSAGGEWTGQDVAGAWRAITFSRATVPAARDWSDALLTATPPLYWQHVGLYAYRRRVLERWEGLPESRLATLESLEQLRAIEAGIPIVAGAIDHAARGIDTPKDYAAFVARRYSFTRSR
jgi:3-deoxy-manno-octulosonate cytidylyltransferase (CMP-KDO synthetase)